MIKNLECMIGPISKAFTAIYFFTFCSIRREMRLPSSRLALNYIIKLLSCSKWLRSSKLAVANKVSRRPADEVIKISKEN